MSKNNRFQKKLNIKKGDKVIVIAGEYKDRTLTRIVQKVIPEKDRVLVEDVNMRKKHMKPTNENQGGIIEINAPIHISNVMLVDPKTGEPTRVGRRVENNTIVRYSKKSDETIK
jgi:large subunit ribosomal protein L24